MLSLSKIKKHKWNSDNLLKSLRQIQPNLNIEDINNAIILLNSKGVITVNSEGEISNLYNRVTTKTGVKITDSHLYYEQVSDLAKTAATLDYSEQKEFQCFSTPLKREDLAQVQSLIRDLRNKVSKIAGDGSDAEEIYQINLQVFPLSNNSHLNRHMPTLNKAGETSPQLSQG